MSDIPKSETIIICEIDLESPYISSVWRVCVIASGIELTILK